MSIRTLYRLSGGTLIVGSVLLLLEEVVSTMGCPGHDCSLQFIQSVPWLIVTLIWLIGSLLFVIGLPGMYLRQAERAGRLGFVGFVLLFLAMLLASVGFSLLQLIVFPYLAQKDPQLIASHNGPVTLFIFFIITGLMASIGVILLGIATMRTRVFPRWMGTLLLIAGIILLLTIPPLPSPIADIVEIAGFAALYIAYIGFGYTLMSQEGESVDAVPFASTKAPMSLG
ncbi:MAG: hypothetical protein NVS2B12_24630 [Ktedonobacteraceae bacterium]